MQHWGPLLLIAAAAGAYHLLPKAPVPHEIPTLAARHWDALPVTAILKSADPKLDTYFGKQQAYVNKLNEFMYARSPELVKRLMVDVRHDPFFPAEALCAYRICYETILMEGPVPRATLLKMFPSNRDEIMLHYSETVTFEEALRVFKLQINQ